MTVQRKLGKEGSEEEVKARVKARLADKEHFRGPGIRTVVVGPNNFVQFRGKLLELELEYFRERHPQSTNREVLAYAERQIRSDLSDNDSRIILAIQGKRPIGYYSMNVGAGPFSWFVFVRPDSRNQRVSEQLTTKAHNLLIGLYGRYSRSIAAGSVAALRRGKFHNRLLKAGGLSAMRPPKEPITIRKGWEVDVTALAKAKQASRFRRLAKIRHELLKQGRFGDLLMVEEAMPISRRRIRKALAPAKRRGR
ncbi:hypothetical protein HYS54_01545 [Candidatus Micrarchaeota archaeon]|nr:hypothetical protein [Candidatus Micrarchaeota archaeon]